MNVANTARFVMTLLESLIATIVPLVQIPGILKLKGYTFFYHNYNSQWYLSYHTKKLSLAIILAGKGSQIYKSFQFNSASSRSLRLGTFKDIL